jgi:hypothetical protein
MGHHAPRCPCPHERVQPTLLQISREASNLHFSTSKGKTVFSCRRLLSRRKGERVLKEKFFPPVHVVRSVTRVSGHSDLCSSRIELEIILTLRRNVLPLLLVEGSGNPSPRGIAEVCKPDQANGLCTRLQSSSSQRWRCGTTARSRRTIASIIWDWTADQDSRSNSWRPGQAIVQAMA